MTTMRELMAPMGFAADAYWVSVQGVHVRASDLDD
jgi:hypothetical protein